MPKPETLENIQAFFYATFVISLMFTIFLGIPVSFVSAWTWNDAVPIAFLCVVSLDVFCLVSMIIVSLIMKNDPEYKRMIRRREQRIGRGYDGTEGKELGSTEFFEPFIPKKYDFPAAPRPS